MPISFATKSLRDYGRRIRIYLQTAGQSVSQKEIGLLRDELRLDKVMSDLDPPLDGTLEGIERLRHPFFTTKPVGKGKGLGLSITEAIVRDHGGTITAANRPNGGAIFTI